MSSNPFAGNRLVNNHSPCPNFGHKQENGIRYPRNRIPFTILNILLEARFQVAESKINDGRGIQETGRLGLPRNMAGLGMDPRPRFNITKCEVPDFPADK
jgi:hypothetical protein